MKSNKLTITAIVVILAAFAAVIAVFVVKKNNNVTVVSHEVESADVTDMIDTEADITPANVYSCDLTVYGDTNSVMYVYFSNYSNIWAIEINDEGAASGTFEMNGNEVITVGTDDDGNPMDDAEIRYILDGEYLLIESGIYDGEIPDGETFNATVTKKDSTGMEIRYDFKEDGTYTCTEIPEGEDEIVMNGTYTREGNLINRTLSDNDMIPFYVYENHLCASFYTEDNSEEAQTIVEEQEAAEQETATEEE